MTNKTIVWTQPESQLSKKILDMLEEVGVEVEARPVNGAHWTWAQFKEASPDWSNLPLIQCADGTTVKTMKEFTEKFGKPNSLFNPESKPWAPR